MLLSRFGEQGLFHPCILQDTFGCHFFDFAMPGNRNLYPWLFRVGCQVVTPAVFNTPAGFDQRPVDVLSLHGPPTFRAIISRNITYVNGVLAVRALKAPSLRGQSGRKARLGELNDAVGPVLFAIAILLAASDGQKLDPQPPAHTSS